MIDSVVFLISEVRAQRLNVVKRRPRFASTLLRFQFADSIPTALILTFSQQLQTKHDQKREVRGL